MVTSYRDEKASLVKFVGFSLLVIMIISISTPFLFDFVIDEFEPRYGYSTETQKINGIIRDFTAFNDGIIFTNTTILEDTIETNLVSYSSNLDFNRETSVSPGSKILTTSREYILLTKGYGDSQGFVYQENQNNLSNSIVMMLYNSNLQRLMNYTLDREYTNISSDSFSTRLLPSLCLIIENKVILVEERTDLNYSTPASSFIETGTKMLITVFDIESLEFYTIEISLRKDSFIRDSNIEIISNSEVELIFEYFSFEDIYHFDYYTLDLNSGEYNIRTQEISCVITNNPLVLVMYDSCDHVLIDHLQFLIVHTYLSTANNINLEFNFLNSSYTWNTRSVVLEIEKYELIYDQTIIFGGFMHGKNSGDENSTLQAQAWLQTLHLGSESMSLKRFLIHEENWIFSAIRGITKIHDGQFSILTQYMESDSENWWRDGIYFFEMTVYSKKPINLTARLEDQRLPVYFLALSMGIIPIHIMYKKIRFRSRMNSDAYPRFHKNES
ncbi:MAG: hypothetical protein ACXAB7_00485 [Candidatus Kariarchaeaceae archaeon]|jgi:hypothetical protein